MHAVSAVTLAGLLRRATRTVRIRGMEGEQIPDLIAQDIVQSSRFNELAALLQDMGVQPIGILGAGASSIVLDTGTHALRLGLGENVPIPTDASVVQPIASGSVGMLRYQLMPKADTRGITQADVETLSAELQRQGYVFGDAGTDNIGRIDGKLIVIDPGAIHQIAPDDADAMEEGEAPQM